MRSDNLSTVSSQPSSACTLKTQSTSSSTSGWSLVAETGPRQWPLAASANHNNNNNLASAAHLPQKAAPNNNNNNKSTASGTSANRLVTGQSREYSCAGNKFHRAAIDGYVDMLCEASKRDTNTHAPDDFLQLTPTLLAAQSGQLEALRILVGRGGDPERVSALGSSALHLAAARNHLNCVSFLVNFGANMWALDNELRTAKDIAALGQCQQVLEYLDQMMAKQSAINTKLVQKLKDRAKVAAEKRLKQMRKQQLKAIKQVERDERLLAKLSSNRRLLKSAHSMSDIKLVGRGDATGSSVERLAAISFSPNEPLISPADYQKATLQKKKTTKVTNFLGHRFQCPPSAASKADRKLTQCSDLDSSYCSSSSVSSATGGYLSSCSARSILKSALAPRRPPAVAEAVQPPPSDRQDTRAKSSGRHQAQQRPKFSDLVAVVSLDSTRQSTAAASATATAALKSESLLTSRLRGIGGGVSRKVHLKRLLFASSETAHGANTIAHEQPMTSECHTKQPPKLCQVGPVSRLKMSMARPLADHTATVASYGQLKRSRSEPDFGSAMRTDEEDQDDNHSECHAASTDHEDEEEEVEEADEQDERLDIPTPPPEPPGPASPSASAAAAAASQHDHPQQHLLTRCLSQLKLKQQQQSIKHNQPPVGPNAAGHRRTTGGCSLNTTSNSDELIRHQLSASEFPLRPSIIKQQLHMRSQQQQQQQHQRGQDEKRRKSTTIMSVDSIGSAGSFAQRNTDELAAGHNIRLRASDRNASSSSSSALSSASFDGSGSGSSSSDKMDAHEDNQADQLAEFLASNNLLELTSVLVQERIDLEALLLLSEADLKSLNILLGPRRKLLNAISQYKSKQQQQQLMKTGNPSFTVVDTQF